MSKPWHDEIAALSLLYLIRDNMGERQGSSGRREEVEVEVERGDGEVEKEAEREERYKMGRRGKGWWEVERWRLWTCNKKGGRGKRAHLEQRGGKEEIEKDGRRDGRQC